MIIYVPNLPWDPKTQSRLSHQIHSKYHPIKLTIYPAIPTGHIPNIGDPATLEMRCPVFAEHATWSFLDDLEVFTYFKKKEILKIGL
jgi:hypothetical protein